MNCHLSLFTYFLIYFQIMGHNVKDGNTTLDNHPKHYSLKYLDATIPIGDTEENNSEFINDIEEFKHDLPIIEIPKVELAQC